MLRHLPSETAASPLVTDPGATESEAVNAEIFDSAIETFLNQIEAELRGLALERRAEIRRELRAHLQASIAACEELGEEPATATAEAIARFGEPKAIAGRYRAVAQQARRNDFRKRWGQDLRPFGLAALIYLLYEAATWTASLQGWIHLNILVDWTITGLLPIAAGIRVALTYRRFSEWRSLAALVALAAITIPFTIYSVNSDLSHAACQKWISFLAFLGAMFVIWIPLGMLSLATTRILIRKPAGPLTSRSAVLYAFQTIAGFTAVEIALSTLWMIMRCEVTRPGTLLCSLFYVGWLALLSPIVIGARAGWETRSHALRSAAVGFGISAVLTVTAALLLQIGHTSVRGVPDYSLMQSVRQSLLWCALTQVTRLPLGLAGAWLGSRMQKTAYNSDSGRDARCSAISHLKPQLPD